MSFDRSSVIELAKTYIGEWGVPQRGGGLEDGEIDRLLDDAVFTYSTVKPDTGFVIQTGDGTTYEWAVPSDWHEGFSTLSAIEWPYNKRTPEYMPITDVIVYEKSTGFYFRILNTTPASGQSIRFEYSRPRILSDTVADSTIPTVDKEPLAHLVAHNMLRRIAADYAKTVPGIVRDDPLVLSGAIANIERLADEQYGLYADRMGITAGFPAVTSTVTLDNRTSWGRPALNHEQQQERLYRP